MTTWLNTEAAAAHLCNSVHEVRRNAFDQSTGKPCPKGSIPGYKVKSRWRFDPAELDRFIRGESITRRPVLSKRSRAS